MRWKIMAVAAVLLLSASVLTLSGPADAEGGGTVSDGSTWYCYGDRPTFLFPSYSEGVNVGWSVTDADDGGTLEPVETSEDGSRITVDLSGHDMVHVTQTVSAGDGPSLSMTIHVIALHLPEDTVYTVRFHDGGRVADTQYIDGSTVVEAGMGHVVPPLIEKQGYSFGGWYAEDYETEFDETGPITGDTDVYAKWTYSGGGGGTVTTVVVDNVYVVTFNTAVGLEYHVDSLRETSLSFTVGVVGGYRLDGAIGVSSDGGTLTHMDGGSYLLSGIDRNIVVTIGGDASPLGKEPEGDGFPWWILAVVVLAVVAAAFAVLWYRARIPGDGDS